MSLNLGTFSGDGGMDIPDSSITCEQNQGEVCNGCSQTQYDHYMRTGELPDGVTQRDIDDFVKNLVRNENNSYIQELRRQQEQEALVKAEREKVIDQFRPEKPDQHIYELRLQKNDFPAELKGEYKIKWTHTNINEHAGKLMDRDGVLDLQFQDNGVTKIVSEEMYGQTGKSSKESYNETKNSGSKAFIQNLRTEAYGNAEADVQAHRAALEVAENGQRGIWIGTNSNGEPSTLTIYFKLEDGRIASASYTITKKEKPDEPDWEIAGESGFFEDLEQPDKEEDLGQPDKEPENGHDKEPEEDRKTAEDLGNHHEVKNTETGSEAADVLESKPKHNQAETEAKAERPTEQPDTAAPGYIDAARKISAETGISLAEPDSVQEPVVDTLTPVEDLTEDRNEDHNEDRDEDSQEPAVENDAQEDVQPQTVENAVAAIQKTQFENSDVPKSVDNATDSAITASFDNISRAETAIKTATKAEAETKAVPEIAINLAQDAIKDISPAAEPQAQEQDREQHKGQDRKQEITEPGKEQRTQQDTQKHTEQYTKQDTQQQIVDKKQTASVEYPEVAQRQTPVVRLAAEKVSYPTTGTAVRTEKLESVPQEIPQVLVKTEAAEFRVIRQPAVTTNIRAEIEVTGTTDKKSLEETPQLFEQENVNLTAEITEPSKPEIVAEEIAKAITKEAATKSEQPKAEVTAEYASVTPAVESKTVSKQTPEARINAPEPAVVRPVVVRPAILRPTVVRNEPTVLKDEPAVVRPEILETPVRDHNTNENINETNYVREPNIPEPKARIAETPKNERRNEVIERNQKTERTERTERTQRDQATIKMDAVPKSQKRVTLFSSQNSPAETIYKREQENASRSESAQQLRQTARILSEWREGAGRSERGEGLAAATSVRSNFNIQQQV